MIIDFNTMETTPIPGFKGGEGTFLAKMHTDPLGKILNGRLPLGSTVGRHAHETSSEMIFILSGEADHICDGVTEHVSAGMCAYCPKGSTHEMITTSQEDLVFFAVVPEQ